MLNPLHKNFLHREQLFQIAMWWRIFYGFTRIILGVTLFWFIGTQLADLLQYVMRHELIEDPNDILYYSLSYFFTHTNLAVTRFGAWYLIFWGCIDIFLSHALLKERFWAFPASILVISIFILYEVYRILHMYSVTLLVIVVLDIIIVWLIRDEQKRIQNEKKLVNV